MLRPSDVATKHFAHQHVLQRIVAIPRQRRCRGHGVRGEPVGQVPLDVGRAGHRDVAHHAQRLHSTSRHRRALGRHRSHHHALAQQSRRVILVLDPDVEQHVVQCGEHPGEPRRHRIGVDRHRNSRRCTVAAAHLSQRLGLQQGGLRGQPQQRNTRSRCRTRLFPHHQHLADPLLERLDPLTDRRRRDVQPLRGRVESCRARSPRRRRPAADRRLAH